MKEIIFYLSVFLIIDFSYVFFVIARKKKLEKFKNNTYVQYLKKMFQLDLTNVNYKLLANVIASANAFIITITLVIVSITDNLIYKMLLAFATLIPMQLLIYYIIGKCYQKKYKRKER